MFCKTIFENVPPNTFSMSFHFLFMRIENSSQFHHQTSSKILLVIMLFLEDLTSSFLFSKFFSLLNIYTST